MPKENFMLLASNPVVSFIHNLLTTEIANATYVDSRDIGMATRFSPKFNPLTDGTIFIMESVHKNQKKLDAFKITEDGYTYYEARLYSEIQEKFKDANGIIPFETLHTWNNETSKFSDYYSRLAKLCLNYHNSKPN